MSIQAVIFDMYETLVTQFCSSLYYGTQIAEDLELRPEEFLPAGGPPRRLVPRAS